MMVTYNGINLQVEQSSLEQRDWYGPDGKEQLGTHFVLRTRCLFHPMATNQNNAVAAMSMSGPTATQTGIRQALLTPRQQLVITIPSGGQAGSVTLLRSPLFRTDGTTPFPMDANYGPSPLYCNVSKIIGETAMIVEFAIETWIVECPTARAILYHRWEQSDSIDQDYFTTRFTRGQAIFRADWLAIQGTGKSSFPDAFRYQFGPPVPANFKRDFVSVTVSADGLNVSYEVRDTQQPSMLLPDFQQRISRIRGYYAEYTARMAVEEMLGDAIAPAGGEAVQGVMNGGIGLIASAANAVTSRVGSMINRIPRLRKEFSVEVFGRPSATRADLANAIGRAMVQFNFGGGRAINTILTGAITLPQFFFNDALFTFDLVNRYAAVKAVADLPGIYADFLGGMSILPGVEIGQFGTKFPEAIDGVTKFDPDATTPGQGPGQSNDMRAREFTKFLVTAAIKGSCEAVQQAQ